MSNYIKNISRYVRKRDVIRNVWQYKQPSDLLNMPDWITPGLLKYNKTMTYINDMIFVYPNKGDYAEIVRPNDYFIQYNDSGFVSIVNFKENEYIKYDNFYIRKENIVDAFIYTENYPEPYLPDWAIDGNNRYGLCQYENDLLILERKGDQFKRVKYGDVVFKNHVDTITNDVAILRCEYFNKEFIKLDDLSLNY